MKENQALREELIAMMKENPGLAENLLQIIESQKQDNEQE